MASSARTSSSSSPSPDVPPSHPTFTSAILHYRTLSASERLSLTPPIRALLATSSGFLIGLALGSSHGSQTAGLRFRAENAHRLPTSQKGWFFYHKSKNYHMALGALRDGVKMGGRCAGWGLCFAVMEEGCDYGREVVSEGMGREGGLVDSKDFVSTTVAGLGTAGVFSAINRLTVLEAARTLKLGLMVGFGYGILQDAVSLVRGRRLGYVDFVWNLRPHKAQG